MTTAKKTDLQVVGDQPVTRTVPAIDTTWRLAKALAYSPLLPPHFLGTKNRKFTHDEVVGSVCLAIVHGQEVGLSPAQSLQSVAVINGRASVYGDAMTAILRASGQFDGKGWKEIFDEKAMAWTCTMKRIDGEERTVTYSLEDAKASGAASRNPVYQSNPKRMLQWRARHLVARDLFPDVLRGLHMAEVAQDEALEEVEGEIIDTSVEPEAPQAPEKALGAPCEPTAVADLDLPSEDLDAPQADDPGVYDPAEEEVNAEYRVPLAMVDQNPDWSSWYADIRQRIKNITFLTELDGMIAVNKENLDAFKAVSGKYHSILQSEYKARKKDLEKEAADFVQ